MLSNSKKLIAVIGATGHQGGAVVRALQAGGQFKVRALTRNPDKHRDLADEVVEADLNRPETLAAAFKGAYGVFLVTMSSLEGTDERKQGAAAVQAARDAGVKHVVWSTLPDVEAISGGKFHVPHFTSKAKVDRIVKDAASLTIGSTLALLVKCGTWNLPPLIASTSGSVDQTTCLTPASLAACTAAAPCLRSSVPSNEDVVTRNTPYAPLKAAARVSGRFKSASTTSSASSRCLSGLRVSARTLNCPRACRARRTPPPCCPVAPITAISFLLLDNTLVLLSSSIIQDLIAPIRPRR